MPNRVLKIDLIENLFLEFLNFNHILNNNIKDHHEILSSMENWANTSKIG